MKQFWTQYDWVIFIVCSIFSAGVWWETSDAQEKRISNLESNYKDIPAALARIEQKVDDLRDLKHGK